jgi:hypothetical protein
MDRDGRMTPILQRSSVDWQLAHLNCRCVRLTVTIPEAARRKLPGMQIDYQQLKEDVRDYFRGRNLTQVKGVRHAESYITGTLQETSPETLTRMLREQRYTVGSTGRDPGLDVLRPRQQWLDLGSVVIPRGR